MCSCSWSGINKSNTFNNNIPNITNPNMISLLSVNSKHSGKRSVNIRPNIIVKENPTENVINFFHL